MSRKGSEFLAAHSMPREAPGTRTSTLWEEPLMRSGLARSWRGCLTKAVRRSPVPSLEEEDVVSAVFLARSVSKKAGIGGSGGYPWIHQQIYVIMFLGDGAGEGRGILLIIQ